MLQNLMHDVYAIDKPKNPLPVIFDSPHSGTHYPDDFQYACSFTDLEKCEDKYVEQLFAGAPKHGVTFLQAFFPRSYIDPNRAADDIDPKLLSAPWQDGDIKPTARSDAGIGLIRRLTKPGIPVYDRPLTQQEIQRRIDQYYRPYHAALQTLIDEAHYNYGQVWHINCHSMPDSTARPRRPLSIAGNQGQSVDFVLGDRDGTSCDPLFTRSVRDFIRNMGYSVTINDPFKGVALVKQYSSPARGIHSLQIEVNKSLYMNEKTGQKSINFDKLKYDLESITQFITNYAQEKLTPLAAD